MLEAPAYPVAFFSGAPASTRKMPIVLAAACCIAVLAALWLGGQANLLRMAFPVAAAIVALSLYFYRPVFYVHYALWVWFLAPFVRRFVDWRFGFVDPNFVLLCPLAVTAVAALTLIRGHRSVANKIPAAFIFCAVAILYGFAVGMIVHPSAEGLYGLLNWSCPMLFGLHLYLKWPAYQQHRDAIRKTFLLGILVMGAYAIYQYVVAPDWDAYWINSLYSPYDIAPSFGLPQPYLLRVWSTMNAPGPFADVLMVGLLLLIGMKSKWKIVSSLLGYIAFLLTSVRTAWIGWLVGFAMILGNSKPKLLIRILLSGGLLFICLIIFARSLPIFPQISERIESFTDLKSDSSFADRTAMYRALSAEVLENPVGRGLNNATDFRGYMVDSGFLLMFFSFGWFGTVAFLSGVVAFLSKLGKRHVLVHPDEFQLACRAICIALLLQLIGGNIFTGVIGAMFWLCAGMIFASQAYHANKALTDPPAAPATSTALATT
jgi:hypothetical protein